MPAPLLEGAKVGIVDKKQFDKNIFYKIILFIK